MAAGKFLAPWDQSLRWWVVDRRRWWTVPALVVPCEMSLTAKKSTNGRVLNVRCRCMAGTSCEPSRRYCNYDPIGEARSLEEAQDLWRRHTEIAKVEAA